MDALSRALAEMAGDRTFFSSRWPGELGAFAGLETRRVPREYDWDGLHRGGDPRRPVALFQYTLSGRGRFRDAAGEREVGVDEAFLAIIPSPHRYYLPHDSSHWSFFWFILPHAYVVRRLAQSVRRVGAVVRLERGGRLLTRAMQLFEGLARDAFVDELALEEAMLGFMLEFERASASRPRAARESLLGLVRARVLNSLSRRLGVERLAGEFDMSRSHFTHCFRAATGLSPARYIAGVRLEQAALRLVNTRRTLKQIARETGLADANHLCKLFRRVYGVSPAQYRRQRRGL